MSMLVSRSCSVSFWDDVPELSTFIWWMVVEHGLNHNLHEQGWKDDMNRCRCLRPSLKRVYFMNRAWREISTIINPVPVQEKKTTTVEGWGPWGAIPGRIDDHCITRCLDHGMKDIMIGTICGADSKINSRKTSKFDYCLGGLQASLKIVIHVQLELIILIDPIK